MGGWRAAIFTDTHHVTHVVTKSLQCRVTWTFCSLKFVRKTLRIFRLLCCAWHTSLNIVLVTRKGQLMKIWAQIKLTTTKSIRKSSGKSIAKSTPIFFAKVSVTVLPIFSSESMDMDTGNKFASIVNKPCGLWSYYSAWSTGWYVGWSLTSLVSTNTAISETKGQGWRVILLSSEGRLNHGHLFVQQPPKKGKGLRGSFK